MMGPMPPFIRSRREGSRGTTADGGGCLHVAGYGRRCCARLELGDELEWWAGWATKAGWAG
jgi:hypothetical protein